MRKRSTNGPQLLTIGYEGRPQAEFIEELVRADVTVLCDVRRNPISRKRGFSKRALAAACAAARIAYVHLPELGIASIERKHLHTAADRSALFARYERETLPRESAALEKIRAQVCDERQRVALVCFERDPDECHRTRVAAALAGNADPALQPINL